MIFNIGVPSEFGNTISIISSKYKTIEGQVIPKPNILRGEKLPVYDFTETENYNQISSGELVTFSEFGFVRDLKLQQVRINPIQFNPLTKKIKIYSEIVFRINFRLDNPDHK